MPARRHHHVPQFYLRGFVTERRKPQLYVVDLKDRKTFHTHPANVAVERDFHRVDSDGMPPDAIEARLARFEGEASESFTRVIRDRRIAGQDRARIIELIAILSVKSPALRERWRGFEEQIVKRALNLATKTPDRWQKQIEAARLQGIDLGTDPPSYEQLRAFVESGAYRIEVPNERHLTLEMTVLDSVLDSLNARNWMLMTTGKHTGFITSDQPVNLMWCDPNLRNGPYAPGHSHKQTQVVFPLSNQLALVGLFDGADGETDADGEWVARFNTHMIATCRRQIYALSSGFQYWSSNGQRAGNELLNDTSIF